MSLVPTYLQDAIFEASSQFTSFENKMSVYGGIQAIVGDTSNGLVPVSEIQSIKKSARQPTKTAVLQKYTATSTPTDSCSPSGQGSTSAFVPLTWASYGFTVEHLPAIYGDNYVGAAADMAHKMRQGFKAVYDAIDSAAIAFLEANKTAATPTSNNFTLASGAFNYTGDPTKIYAYVPSFMNKMDLTGPYISVGDTEHQANLLLTNTLGVNNSQNLAGLQNGSLAYSGQFSHHFSNRLSAGVNNNKFYIFPTGSTAVVDWVHPQYASGMAIGEDDYWFTASDPLFGFQWEAHYKSECADVTGTYSSVPAATKKETIWFGLKLAFVDTYSSDTTTPIVSFTIN